jgi:transaldolase
LAAPGTIDTLPQKRLIAFADHGRLGMVMPVDGGYADDVLQEFRRDGVDDEALAQRLQQEGVAAFATSWYAMLSRIREKSTPAVAVAT